MSSKLFDEDIKAVPRGVEARIMLKNAKRPKKQKNITLIIAEILSLR